MTFVILRVMVLNLLRDRGALVMAFILPPMMYLTFTTIFAGSTDADLKLRVALFDTTQSDITRRLAIAIRADDHIRIPAHQPISENDVRTMVREDAADVGVIIRADPSVGVSDPQSPILLIGDAAKVSASGVIAGRIQQIFGTKLADAAYRRVLSDFERSIVPFTPEQRKRADAVIEFIERSAAPDASKSLKAAITKRATPPLISQTSISNSNGPGAAVVYYAGAVAILFMMYSAMHSAMSLIDERQEGIYARIINGPGSLASLFAGKFLFLFGLGILQVALVFALADSLFDVDIISKFPTWLAITATAAAAMAALGLALSAACQTRQQAQNLSTFLVLVLSALGGSMVPRFLMPPWLQDMSWILPNAWIIEAYQRLMWRGADFMDLLPLIGAIAVFAAALTLVAWALMCRLPRLI